MVGAVADVRGGALVRATRVARPDSRRHDEALANVPGVFVANRYNFSQDQRISIRGFGARSAFAVRGIKILVDGIPQTLPDGQGQLTNLELGEVDRIEIGELALSVGKRLRDAVHENLDP